MIEEFIGYRSVEGELNGKPLFCMGLTDVRIVRCNDCKYRDITGDSDEHEALVCTVRPMSRHYTIPSGFCHLAELRERDARCKG